MKIGRSGLAMVLSALAWASAADVLETEQVTVGTAKFQVEIARTDQQLSLIHI